MSTIVENLERQNRLHYALVDNIERHRWTGADQSYISIYRMTPQSSLNFESAGYTTHCGSIGRIDRRCDLDASNAT